MFFEAFSNKSVFIFKIKLVKIAYSIFYFVKYCYFLFKPFFKIFLWCNVLRCAGYI